MIKYHIQNELTNYLKECKRFLNLTEEEHIRLYIEVKNATLQGISDKLIVEAGSRFKRANTVDSLLLWVLEITDEYPNNSIRIKSVGSYADIDSDFEKNNRDRVISYIREKYGNNKTCQVLTVGTMTAKAALRNSTRALGFPVEIGNKIVKFIPEVVGITIQECLDSTKEFSELYLKDKDIKNIIDIARKLEGLPNTISCHASALVITDKEVNNYFPVMAANRKESGTIISQFDMKDIESNFILKWDILGIKTLDVIHMSIDLIKKNHNIDLDINSINYNDSKIYELLINGHNAGVFQCESDSFKQALIEMRPSCIEDMSAINAIERPGCLQNGIDKQYILAKNEGKKYDYNLKDKKLLNKVWDICKETYGLMIYQEQTLKCFSDIAGFDGIESDNSRRLIGKKIADEMKALKGKFVERSVQNGYTSKKDLEILFDQIELYSGYQFNKSHSLAYSVNSCQTAWLSVYYPLEFFTALLTIDSGNTGDVIRYIKALKERGFFVLVPDINKSDSNFIIKNNSIIFGLSGVKGVGLSTSKRVLSNRPKSLYKGLGHFINRNYSVLNSKILESYTKAGCFKSFGYNKETVLQSIPYILEFLGIYKSIEQQTIFDLCKIPVDEYVERCIIKNSNLEDNLSYEIDSLGLYITKHPLDDYIINEDECSDISKFSMYEDGMPFATVGCISRLAIKKTKAKTNMATFDLTSSNGIIECIMFSSTYNKYINSDILVEGKAVYCFGKCKADHTKMTLMVNEISDNLKPYLCKVEKKEKDVEFTDLEKLKEDTSYFAEKCLNVKLSNGMKMILEKV